MPNDKAEMTQPTPPAAVAKPLMQAGGKTGLTPKGDTPMAGAVNLKKLGWKNETKLGASVHIYEVIEGIAYGRYLLDGMWNGASWHMEDGYCPGHPLHNLVPDTITTATHTLKAVSRATGKMLEVKVRATWDDDKFLYVTEIV